MSKIGYYRYKTTVEDGKTVALYVNGVLSSTATINALDYCEGFKILKFLDKNGVYRFHSFTKYYETNDSPTLIGTTNKFITNIYSAQSNSKNIGYKNERTMSLTSEVPTAQLDILQDLYTSPRIYLYVGSGADSLKDWLEVTRTGGDTIVRRRKAGTGLVTVEITLPEWFTVKMI